MTSRRTFHLLAILLIVLAYAVLAPIAGMVRGTMENARTTMGTELTTMMEDEG